MPKDSADNHPEKVFSATAKISIALIQSIDQFRELKKDLEQYDYHQFVQQCKNKLKRTEAKLDDDSPELGQALILQL